MLLILSTMLWIAACSTVTSDELLAEASACGKEEACQPLWDAWNKAEERALEKQRKRAFMSQCGTGAVLTCNNMTAERCYTLAKRGNRRACQCECTGPPNW